MEEYLKLFDLNFQSHTNKLNEEDIKTVEQLQNLYGDEEFFEKITKDINDESEKMKWRKALKMNQKIDIDVESVNGAYARKKDLEDALQEKGLDSKYWISKFEECLSISSKAALEYVDHASFVKLKRHIRFNWEKKALMELMNIKNDSRFGQMREADQDKAKKRMEDAKQIISDLNDLKEKGKQLGDSCIDEKMKEIRDALQIPDSAWISQDKKDLKDAIASFVNLVTNVDGIDRKDLSESDVLQSASAGLALKGLLFSKKFEEGDYRQVLAPPNEVKFLGTAISPKAQINSFTSTTSKSNFTKALENYGYSVAASVKGSYGLVFAEVGGSYRNNKENEEERLITSSVAYYGQVKYEMIPLASYTFPQDQLRLTEECIEELQKLEKVITATIRKEIQQSACEKFFREYGSHVNCGPIHFGGTFYWISDYYSETHQDRKTVKKLSEEAMGAFVNASYAGMAGVSTDVSARSLKGSFTGDFNESELQKTSFRIETKGGPSECSALPQWKTGLVLSNATWSVVDRGHNFKGIWELLKVHAQRFSAASDFETNLCKAWGSMTGLTARQYLENKELLEAQNDLDELLSEIPTYLKDNLFSQNCASYLQTLAKGRTKAIVRTHNPDIWCKAIQQKTDMINLLELVFIKRDSYGPLDLSAIKSCLKQILTDTDDFSFKSKINLKHWIRSKQSTTIFENTTPKASDIVSFITSIQSHVIPQLQDSQDLDKSDEEKDKRAIEATCNFSSLTKEVLESSVKNGETNAENLLKLLLYQMRYNFNGGYYSSRDVTFERVKWFLAELDGKNKEMSSYQTKGQKELDGFILQIVYEFADKEDGMEHKLLTYSNLLGVLNLNEDCAKFVKSHGKMSTDWTELKFAIASRKDGIKEKSGLIANKLCQIFEEPEQQDVKTSPSENDETFDRSSTSLKKDFNKIQILETLGLKKFYPNKITLSDVRKKPVKKIKSFDDLPWYLLTKILLLDYRGRNKIQISQTMDQNDVIDKYQDDSENEDDLLRQIMKEAAGCEGERINPMDAMIALFLCSSNFLKQLLAQKLNMCKLSIPFLIPDVTNRLVLQIWPLRDIILSVTGAQTSALKTKLPIITFVRTGELPRSKSKLLNELLSDQSHDMFFHQNCKNGDIKSVLSKGTVDTSWYLASKRAKCCCNAADDTNRFCQCHFLDTMMFLNLHGNCEDFGDQLQVLCKVSNMMVVMVNIDEIKNSNVIKSLRNIAEISEKVLLIVTKIQGIQRSMFDVKKAIKKVGYLKKLVLLVDFQEGELKNKNLGFFRSEIIGKINKYLNNFDCKTLLEALEQGKCINGVSLITDEDNIANQTGQARAQDIYDVIKDYEIHEAKAMLLPLQGHLWQKWGEIKKKENRTSQMHGLKSVEHYQSQLYRERQNLRLKQVRICENLSKVMKQFIHNLLGLNGDARLYFLHWLRIYLDESSRAELPPIEDDYSKVWSKLQNLLKNKDNQLTDQNKLKSSLNDLERKLEESSFGLEHLLREMGQIYEAVMDTKDKLPREVVEKFEKLPNIMGELLLAGYPMEIMDGNTAHVPLKWVQAVFTKVKLVLGNKKIFVLSVLGIQSSGKSTLLNTMFGLQFAVRAGRCTQGVFSQLVRLPENSGNREYDYIMVVDTEGLRAPEFGFGNHQHDNELATLAIGISDLTLINIKGENQSEIQDVLQIVVHAFVRMQIVNKNMKLKSSCFFIHQNVGADDAEKNMQRGRIKLLKKLDEIAQAAAETEKVTNIKKFSDIINFDVESNIKNFTNLWQGEPPMAPVNPGYSEKVEEVRKVIYEVMPARKSHSTVDNISIRIGDLWRGILADDFVFNFRNSLEIKAFNSLELKRNNLSFTMKNELLKWFNDTALLSIRKAKDPISTKTKLEVELKEIVREKHTVALKDLKEFFSSSEDRETLEQWKTNSLLKLFELKEDIIKTNVKAIDDEVFVRDLKITQNAQFSKCYDEISKKTIDLAIELQGVKLKKDELYSKFNFLWIEMQTKQSPRASAKETVNVKDEVNHALITYLSQNNLFLNKKLESGGLRISVPDLFNFQIQEGYFSPKNFIRMPQMLKSSENRSEVIAHEYTQFVILKNIPVYFKKIEDQNFSNSQVDILISDVANFINEWNKNEKHDFLLTKKYEVSILVHVCRFALPRFVKMHEAYMEKIDPAIEEERLKKRLYITFKNIYERSANEKIAADLLCDIIRNHIKNLVDLSLPPESAIEVRKNHSFMGSAGLLKAQVLKELLDLDSFKEYEAFLDDNRACISQWLLKYVNFHLFSKKGGKSKYAVLSKVKLDSLLTNIESVITSHFVPDNGAADAEVYWATFTEELQKIIPVTPEEINEVVKTETVFDFRNLSSFSLKNLSTIRDYLYGEYDAATELPMDHGPKIIKILAEYCLGCPEQCPFCKAPCKITSVGHIEESNGMDHCVIEHYPQGVGSYRGHVSEKLVTDTCTTLVCSEQLFGNTKTNWEWKNYKDYKDLYPKWSIPKDDSLETSCYWKRFMAKFSSALASKYNAKEGDIPQAWHNFTKRQAKESIEKLV